MEAYLPVIPYTTLERLSRVTMGREKAPETYCSYFLESKGSLRATP